MVEAIVRRAASLGFTAIVVTADHPTNFIVERFLPHFISTPGLPVCVRTRVYVHLSYPAFDWINRKLWCFAQTVIACCLWNECMCPLQGFTFPNMDPSWKPGQPLKGVFPCV